MKRLAVLAVVAFVTLMLIEGLASLVITAGLYFGPSSRFAQDRYSRYDPELGWVALPNVALPDMWGPGIGLFTDANGFRGRVETPLVPPEDKVRVMCSGDSFTFGSGVADEATWCAHLAWIDRRIESINLGQGGYGVDQAFLRFRRDGARFHPKVHLFAVIDADFDRMRSNRFLEYGKPTLAVRNGTLTVDNVPAPAVRSWVPSIRTTEILRRTRSSELVDRFVRRFSSAAPSAAATKATPPPDVVATAVAVIDALAELAKKDDGRLVIVRLPTAGDCRGAPPVVDWWAALAPELFHRGLLALDLSESCRMVPWGELDTFFIPASAARYWGGEGHYTVEGNRFFAEAISAQIRPIIDAARR